MTKRPVNLAYDRNGALVRWCTECKKWLKVKEFNRRLKDTYGPPKAWHWFHLCKNCRSRKYNRTKHNDISGYVPVRDVWWIYDELADRIGMVKAAEASGITYDNLRLILYRKSIFVQRRNVRSAIVLLKELRRENVRTSRTGRKPAYRKYDRQAS